MKRFLVLLAVASSFTNAYAGVSCVYTKTKTLPNYNLALAHPITVYREPDAKSESHQITDVGAYYVTAVKNGYIKLADPRYYGKNRTYSFARWANRNDFDAVAYRNCVAASTPK